MPERLMARLERVLSRDRRRPLKAITSADVVAMVRTVEARGALNISWRLKQHIRKAYKERPSTILAKGQILG